MDDQELDALVASAASARDTTIAAIGVDDMLTVIRELAASDSASSSSLDRIFELRQVPHAKHHPWAGWIAAAAVLAIAITGAGITVVVKRNRGGLMDSASSDVAPARTGPRLLVTENGWTVTRADEDSDIAGIGEMEFSNGRNRASLMWRPASLHQSYVDDRAHSADPPTDISIDGHPGVLFRYTGANDFTALWLSGKSSLELRADFDSESAYRAFAASVRTVAAADWLRALPASAVRPGDRSKVIEEMLAGVPVPAKTDRSRWNAPVVADRYSLGALVVGSVACAWFDQWVVADADGDAVAKTEATEAIIGFKSWPIMVELGASGFVPQPILESADDVAADRTSASQTGGIARIRSREYAQGMGCARFTAAGNTWPAPTYMPSP
jgi:hypothetical protein